MRTPWWQSIRWRLALGSMLVALLAVTLLALAAIFSVTYYYGVEQRSRLDSLAAESAQQIGANYPASKNLGQAAALAFAALGRSQRSQNQGYATIVLNRFYDRVYPLPVVGPQRALAGLPKAAQSRIRLTVIKAQQGITSDDDLGGGLVTAPRPFVAQPIHEGGQSSAPVIGVLIMIPRAALSNTASPFLATTSQFVLMASLIVAVLAAVAATLFSRTITRPLAKMTNAARVLASRNYSARVQTGAQGELGELARSFNEMAARLEYDVNELHRQELWRRELIMNITHDLATPLTAIAGLGESLVDGVNQSREDYEATGLIIVRETLRLRRLVKDLHMMAKVEAGALHPQRKAIRLAALVDEVLAVLATEFERANVEPRNMIAYDLPVFYADPDMLTRVFTNLCDNALRYTPAGGAVTIDATRHGNQLGISVTDTGPGIPPAALSRLFDRFYRVDVSRQLATGGSGLGLAIVRAILEAHGGTIWAENSPQGGARIVFTLPLAP
jgi:signal transduction histidine kinase